MSSPDDGNDGSDGPDDAGPDDSPTTGEGGSPEAGAEGGERRRRRRRRRGAQGAQGAHGDQAQGRPQQGQQPSQGRAQGEAQGDPPQQGQPQQGQPPQQGEQPPHGEPQQPRPQQGQQGQRQPRQQGQPQQGRPQQQQRGGDNRGGNRDQQRGGGNRDQQRPGDNRGGNRDQQRGAGNRDQQRAGDNRGGNRDQQGPGASRTDNRGGNRDQQRPGDNRGGNRDQQRGRGGDNRGRRSEGRDNRESREQQAGAGGEADLRTDDDDLLRGDPYRTGGDEAPAPAARQTPIPLDARPGEEEEVVSAPAVAWGSEDDSPAPPIALAPDLPVDAPSDDPDPLTFPLVNGPGAQLGDDVASVVGVRFVPAGRLQYCDAGDGDFTPGERVMVDAERGPRLAWIATPPSRRATRDRGLRRVIRRANDQDLRSEREGDADRTQALRIAKDKAAALKLPLKVFRVEKSGGKLNVYYTSDERLDLRDFVRDVGQATGLRLELRQLGVRDEAKVVGGIGSCGLTLCCTTWLPDFVPVSIKMAKDQGLVLSPTKVSGQCGRLKCCLVYEQAGYAELRKGLPKLGKRVISQRGEGRVVEVDVLRQRVRVSYGAGDTEVLPATEVKPMFPPGNQQRAPERDGEHEDADDEPDLPQS